VGILLGVG